MALKADTHKSAREARIADVLPQADAGALSDLGLSPRELEQLQRRIRGKVVVPGMPEYAAARIGNPVYPETFSPRIVVYCATPHDVRACIAAARRHGWPVTCRSGGHSSAGFSVNDGMVIDVSLMNHVVVDPHRHRAVVGAGANLGQLNAVLDVYGLHVPGGTCADVGVAGHMMGGGYGFTSRQYGMNCDRVIGVRMMLADGTIAEATPDVNADLHWAVRGGTGNQFGVLLDVSYDLVDLYEVWGFCLRWDASDAAQVLAELQSGYMRSGASDALGYLAVYTTFPEGPGLAVIGTYHGSPEAGRAELAPLLAIGNPAMPIDKVDTYANQNDALLDVLPGIPPPASGGVYEAKQPAYLARPLGADGWQRVLDHYEQRPNPYDIVVLEPYGGAISAYPAGESAFIHRAVDADFFVDSFWTGDPSGPAREQAEAFLAGYLELVAPWADGHQYQDYPSRGLADYRWAYWGDAFPTLLSIRRKYDPDGFFDFEQAITAAPAGVRVSEAAVRFPDAPIERLPRPQRLAP